MGASTDLTVTPRPIYHADGRKSPDAYTYPPQLHDNLTGPLGDFPLFQYWGPTASIKSTKWIADAAKIVLDNEQLDLLLVYLPHLDYDHQRFGPEGPEALNAARELDEVLGDLVDHCRDRGDQVVVLSRVRHHARQAPGRDQPRAAPRRPAERLHAGGHGVPGPVDLARLRGLRPPDRARVYSRTRPTSRPRARRSPRLDGVGEVLEGEALAAAGLGARALRRARRARRARRLVHVPLLARQRARPGLRPPGRDPPQAGLRPRRAVHGPRRREGRQAARRPRARAQDHRLPLRDERRRAWTRPSTSRARTACCPRATRTARSSCAARSHTRASAWRRPTSGT